MRIALWIASPPTCSVLTPRASLTAMTDPYREPLTPLNAARRAPDFLYVFGELLHGLRHVDQPLEQVVALRLALHVADAPDVLLEASDRVIGMVRCGHSRLLAGNIARYSCKNPAKYPDCR